MTDEGSSEHNPLEWPSGPRENSSLARWAFWLGMTSLLCGLTGPFALAVGLWAKRDIRAQPGRYSNASDATVGVVIGLIWVGLFAAAVPALLISR
jgi:hypothetical protein